jgi:putative secretion ATPase (PEP-CTERM system associated)
MYEEFYKLIENPFQIVPNPAYLYMSDKHKNALTYLEYGLTESVGFVLLTGEIGSGKTTLIRYLLNQIKSDMQVAVVFNTNVNSEQLLALILQEFKLEAQPGNKAKNLETLNQFLLEKYSSRKRALLIIDEAQNLSNEALEEVRMLSNVQSDEQTLLQILLVGQPDLRARLKAPSLVQFSQRIAVRYHLRALTREETENYILFRLQKAGSKSGIFTPRAVDRIYQASAGIPRTINLLCDSALIYGFAEELMTIDAPVIETVITETGIIGPFNKKSFDTKVELSEFKKTQGNGFMRRLQTLEAGLQKLHTKIDWQIRELQKKPAGYKDELLAKLIEIILAERRRQDDLLKLYKSLKIKYKTLTRTEAKKT